MQTIGGLSTSSFLFGVIITFLGFFLAIGGCMLSARRGNLVTPLHLRRSHIVRQSRPRMWDVWLRPVAPPDPSDVAMAAAGQEKEKGKQSVIASSAAPGMQSVRWDALVPLAAVLSEQTTGGHQDKQTTNAGSNAPPSAMQRLPAYFRRERERTPSTPPHAPTITGSASNPPHIASPTASNAALPPSSSSSSSSSHALEVSVLISMPHPPLARHPTTDEEAPLPERIGTAVVLGVANVPCERDVLGFVESERERENEGQGQGAVEGEEGLSSPV